MNIYEKIKLGKEYVQKSRAKEATRLYKARDKWWVISHEILGMRQRISDFLATCHMCAQYPEFKNVKDIFTRDDYLYVDVCNKEYKAKLVSRWHDNICCFMDDNNKVTIEFVENDADNPDLVEVWCDNAKAFIKAFESLEKRVDKCYFKVISEG